MQQNSKKALKLVFAKGKKKKNPPRDQRLNYYCNFAVGYTAGFTRLKTFPPERTDRLGPDGNTKYVLNPRCDWAGAEVQREVFGLRG